MAAKKKKSAGSAAKGKSPQKKVRRKKNALMPEIVSIFSIAASILIIISLFNGNSAGFAGTLIKNFLKGLFGIGAYILPFVIIGLGLYIFFGRSKQIPSAKLAPGIFLFLFVCCFTHALTYDRDAVYTGLLEYIPLVYADGDYTNGGLFGALLGNAMLRLLGAAGTYILLSSGIIITVILLTGRSLIGFFLNIYGMVREMLARDDDDYEYEEVLVPERPAPKPRQNVKKPTPEPPRRKKTVEAKAFVIEDKTNEKSDKDEDRRILLVSEEMNPSPVVKAKKGAVVDFAPRKPAANPEDKIPHPVKSEPPIEIKVRGLIEEEPVKAEPVIAPLFGDSKTVMDETEPLEQDSLIDEPEQAYDDEDDDFYDEDTEDYDEDILPLKQAALTGMSTPRAGTTFSMPSRNAAISKPAVKAAAMPSITGSINENVEYRYPTIDFLNKNPTTASFGSRAQVLENSRKLEDTLKSFGVEAKVIEVSKGPTVTRYELSPGQGVKVSSISKLSDDLALNLAAAGIRIEAPIPGKAAVGIEVPNKEVTPVFIREVIDDDLFRNHPSKLAVALGKDITGNTVVADIAKMPHVLVAGATGSGKSVCINTIVTSILYKAHPNEVKLLMIDPKVVELGVYNGIPHLLIPVVTDPKKAAGALNWAVAEMISRYNLFAETGVRDLKGYNSYITENAAKDETDDEDENKAPELLPQIVIIVDELADLMMAAAGEVEDAICRLAQMARAAGIHLIIATQRPSVDVITGLIKANIPSRLAFMVSSGTDSRTVLNMVGAEKLLGKGDMLFFPVGMNKPLRVQGAYISDEETENIVNHVKAGYSSSYDPDMISKITSSNKMDEVEGEVDEFFEEAIEFIIQKEKASASMLQRQFRIGYNRASRLIEDLEARGIVGAEDGSKPRKVLMTPSQWREYKSNN